VNSFPACPVKRGLYAQCETTQVREQGKGAGLFGYTSLYGSVLGGQAQFLRVPQAQFGPVKVVVFAAGGGVRAQGPAVDGFQADPP
jgi:threonine dehydrogenase-like Zn-dependent dehydrogenase